MIGIVGIVVIFVMVFGGYLAAGGKMTIILKSLPYEMMMIGGAAVGAFLISNDAGGIKHTIKDRNGSPRITAICSAFYSRSSVLRARTRLRWSNISKTPKAQACFLPTPRFKPTKRYWT